MCPLDNEMAEITSFSEGWGCKYATADHHGSALNTAANLTDRYLLPMVTHSLRKN